MKAMLWSITYVIIALFYKEDGLDCFVCEVYRSYDCYGRQLGIRDHLKNAHKLFTFV